MDGDGYDADTDERENRPNDADKLKNSGPKQRRELTLVGHSGWFGPEKSFSIELDFGG
jgi:hypothetical protein